MNRKQSFDRKAAVLSMFREIRTLCEENAVTYKDRCLNPDIDIDIESEKVTFQKSVVG